MMTKKKLRIIQVIPNLDIAGAERMCSLLATMLKEQRHEVIVISLYSKKTSITDELEKKGVQILYLDKKKGIDLFIVLKLFKIFKKIRPNIVHTHLNALIYVVIPCLVLNIRICHTIHNIASKEIPNLSMKIHRILFRRKKVIPVAISPLIKETVFKTYNLNRIAIPMIYNGIDLSRCKVKNEYREQVSKIIHVGRFSLQKNHIMLIESFSEILKMYPNIKLFLVGTGELLQNVRDQVKQLNISDSVVFLGLVDNVFDLLNDADIFVLPSLYEGFPISIIEALGTALPIVATDVGGTSDIITNDTNGLLCDINKDDFLSKLRKLIDNNDFYRKIGEEAFKTSKNYSLEIMTKNYLHLYEEIIDEY